MCIDEKYKVTTYSVVSLPLCISVPNKLKGWSTPKTWYKEYKKDNDAFALTGLNIPNIKTEIKGPTLGILPIGIYL